MTMSPDEPRSTRETDDVVYAFGCFRADPGERRLYRAGEPVALTAKAFDLLLILIEEPGRLRTRDALIERLWPRTIVEENNLSWHIRAVRKALDDTAEPVWIETVRGHGYRFLGVVRREPRASTPQSPSEPASSDSVATPPADPPVAILSAAPGDGNRSAGKRTTGRDDRRWSSTVWWTLLASAILALAAWAWLRPAGEPRTDATASPTDRATLAVLPFTELEGNDPDGGWFAAGIQSTILAKLAAVSELKVLARSATLDLAVAEREPSAVAVRLGARYVLHGTVQRHKDRINVNVVLTEPSSSQHVWGETYTRRVVDVFEVQNDIAEQVTRALRVALSQAERRQVRYVPTRNMVAYDHFLRAEYLADQVARQSAADAAKVAREARGLYRQAITEDPLFALAWARLSYLESLSGWYYLDTDPATQRAAEQSARTAIALAPDLPQGHLALGFVHYYRDRDYEQALAAFELARIGQPGDGEINVAMAGVLRRQGRVEAAVDAYEQAIARDPRNPRWHLERGHALMMLRRYEAAIESYGRSLAANPDQEAPRAHQVIAALMQGDLHAAARSFDSWAPAAGENRYRYGIAFAIAWLDHDAEGALAALTDAPDWVITPFQPTTRTPSALLRGMALTLKADPAAAAQAFRAAGQLVEAKLTEGVPDRNVLVMQALVLAHGGQAQQALELARSITDRLPLERDAVTAPPFHLALAEILALADAKPEAIAVLRALLERPAGHVLSPALIRLDPRFDAVREELPTN